MVVDMQWVQSFPGAVTVCDRDGRILMMNEKAQQTFANDGGAALVGRSLFDCHSDASNAKLRSMLASGETNVYTIEKKGVKKLIYQSPWYENGVCAGLVELSLEIPAEMPHFIRG